MYIPKKRPEINLLREFRVFSLLWLLLTLVFLLTLTAESRPFLLTQPERMRRWIQVSFALILVIYLHIPILEKRLGQYYLLLALFILSTGSLVTLFVPFNSDDPNLPSLFEFLFSLTRSFIIWMVIVIIIGWRYTARFAIVYSILMGAVTVASILQIDNLRLAFIVDHVTMTLFLTVGFCLVGYLVARFRTIERQRQAELKTANEQLIDYANTLERLTISQERNRLARELHDTLAHTLSGLAVQMETTRRYWDVDNDTAKQMFEQSLTLTRSGLDETRRALTSLRASPLEELGLLLALAELAKSAKARAGIQLNLNLPAQLPPLSSAIEQAIYRIAQEAIANVIKHATAQTLTMCLDQDDQIRLLITDDGVGFLPEHQPPDGHFGLVGMQERARLIGGSLTIQSQPNQGTTVKLTI
ncbi:MAG: sensor histidine kinase [Chloroflexota bacterium]